MPRKTYNSEGPNAEDKALMQFTDMMIAKIESLSKDAKWQQPWFSENAMAWPKNLSMREYNGMNAVMLKMVCEKNGYDLPVFATFNRLTSLNYQNGEGGPIPLRDHDGKDMPRVMVNKGEKSTPVFLTSYTCIHKDTKEKIPYEDYRRLDAEEQKKFNVYPRTHVYNVFAIQQTNLKEARPELYAKLEANCKLQQQPHREGDMSIPEELDAMIKEQKWICPINEVKQDKCYYSISRNSITMVPRDMFKSGESFCTNLYHEMCHSELGLPEMQRVKPEDLGKPGRYEREELTAELTAALVGSRFGQVKYLKADSAVYLKSWLDSLHESPQYLKSILGDVKKASSFMIQRFDEVKQELENRKAETQEQKKGEDKVQGKLKDLGTFSIPEWSLNYLANGDATGLSDEDKAMVDKFVKENFPNGFVMNVDFDKVNEFDHSPAFGLATKTVSVEFRDANVRQDEEKDRNLDEAKVASQDVAAKAAPETPKQEEEVHYHRGR